MKNMKSILFTVGIGLFLIACGKEKDEGNFASLSAKVENPTGELHSAEDARGLALAFELQVGGFGVGAQFFSKSHEEPYQQFRNENRQGDQTTPCPAGGDISVSVQGNKKQASADISYNQCCYLEECCYDGAASWHYSSDVSTASYSYCGEWDLSSTCFGVSASMAFDGCLSSDGSMWYVIEFQNKVFVVRGSVVQGSGEWTVRSIGGVWECSSENGKGKCMRGNLVFEW